MKLNQICESVAVNALNVGDVVRTILPEAKTTFYKITNRNLSSNTFAVVGVDKNGTQLPQFLPGWLVSNQRPTDFYKVDV